MIRIRDDHENGSKIQIRDDHENGPKIQIRDDHENGPKIRGAIWNGDWVQVATAAQAEMR